MKMRHGSEEDWIPREPNHVFTDLQRDKYFEWSEQFDIQISPIVATVLFEQEDWLRWSDVEVRQFFIRYDGMDKDQIREQIGREST